MLLNAVAVGFTAVGKITRFKPALHRFGHRDSLPREVAMHTLN
jgi:hypothetical protein